MTLFFSVRFNRDAIRHTGVTEYLKGVSIDSSNFAKHEKTIIHACRVALLKKLPDWGRSPEEIVSSHFFYRNGDEEIFFFKWEKD